MSQSMTERDRRRWAQEELMATLDSALRRVHSDTLAPAREDEEAILRQRNRVAKLLRFPEKALGELFRP